MTKRFALTEADILPMVRPDRGTGIASDLITVHGEPVRWMYRQVPTPTFSGWLFFSGREDDDYLEDPGNFGVYDLNVIANYDPAIIQLLGEPAGSAFSRSGAATPFLLASRSFEPEAQERRGEERRRA